MSNWMEKHKVRISLRYKLLAALTVLPIICLSLYLVMAMNLFEKDKIAYVFDSSATVARSLATQVRMEGESFLSKVRPILENYQPSNRAFNQIGRSIFDKEKRIDSLILFQKNAGRYYYLGQLVKPDSGFSYSSKKQLIEQVRGHADANGLVIQRYEESDQNIIMAYRSGQPQDSNQIIVICLFKSPDLLDAFQGSTLYASFLVEKSGGIALGPDVEGLKLFKKENAKSFFAPILTSQLPEGTAEVQGYNNEAMLVSYSDAGLSNLVVASVVPRKEALQAGKVLLAKSLLFFIALIASTIIFSVFASVSLTATLRELYGATLKIAQGNFDVRVVSRSKDEIGGLADSFNWMAGEVSRLLRETAQKARMENELATVKAVQETLFPKEESQFGKLSIKGYFEPASECGGDWWNYSQVDNKIFIWIGDATGHGAPSALITSAAKSAAAIIETMPNVTPAMALTIMNRAIYETSKGKILMTFFSGCFDLAANTFTYANASHDPPFLIRKNSEGAPLKKKDLLPLIDANGPRLGDVKDASFTEVTIKIMPGDNLLFYTDGIVDLQSPDGKVWGEREFIKAIISCANLNSTVIEKMDDLKSKVAEYRQDSELKDDITVFMCQIEGAA